MMGAPLTAHERLEQIDVIVRAVDRRGREMDERWGVGRLPTLVPHEIGEKFRVQRRKFSAALMDYDLDETRKHGDAMIRAYAKLNELATAAHGEPGAPEQWEFTVDGQLIVLVRDLAHSTQDRLQGRQGQVWSLDEIASVLRLYPALAAAKSAFPGAIIESVRPPTPALSQLNDDLAEVPF